MEILTKTELSKRFDEIVNKIKNGAIFIHPTDTIYGIGCNALDNTAVRKVRALKHQFHQPFSIWIPSLAWVEEHCEVTAEARKWLLQLPGPYTLILKLRANGALAEAVTLHSKPSKHSNYIGLRYPNHWFRKVVEKAEIPIITTSANKTSQPFMTRLEDLDAEIAGDVEFMIYEGEKKARPSKIINVVEGTVKER